MQGKCLTCATQGCSLHGRGLARGSAPEANSKTTGELFHVLGLLRVEPRPATRRYLDDRAALLADELGLDLLIVAPDLWPEEEDEEEEEEGEDEEVGGDDVSM